MKKNKIIELFGGLSIAVAGIAAVVSGVKENNAESVSAVDDYNIYLTQNWSWYDFYIHYWGGSEGWVAMSKSFTNASGGQVWCAAIPSNATGFQFQGKDSGNTKYSKNINGFSNNSAYTFDSWDSGADKANMATVDFKPLTGGDVIYLDYSVADWTTSSAVIECEFYHDTTVKTVTPTKVFGDSNTKIFEFLIPDSETTEYFTYKCRRYNSKKTEKWNEFLKDSTSKNANKINKDDWNYIDYSWTFTDTSRVDDYATYFLGKCPCSGEGAVSFVSSDWDDVKNEFNSMSLGARKLFNESDSDKSGSGLKGAAGRYDDIVSKHGSIFVPFASRSNSAPLNYVLPINSVDTSIWIISSVTIVGLTAIGGYFFYKKRKEQQ